MVRGDDTAEMNNDYVCGSVLNQWGTWGTLKSAIMINASGVCLTQRVCHESSEYESGESTTESIS